MSTSRCFEGKKLHALTQFYTHFFRLAFCFTILLNFGQVQNQGSFDTPHKRFEYKYSFKGPYLAQKDATVPFWEYEGNAIASEEMVRITPSLRSKKGAIWSKLKTNFDWFEVDLWFRISGRGRLGADGMAFWYTENKTPEGPVFGAGDNWKGLGVFFDSFDNDNAGNNPVILAMANDGTKQYQHESDGAYQQLGSCLRDFRNKPFPTRAKISYYQNVLEIWFHSGNSNNDEYELCMRVQNLYLPKNGYFGISAATGSLADDHDVLKFLTYSLYSPSSQQQQHQGQGMADQEREKFAKEYEDYKVKLEKQKQDYFKEHPDEAKKYEHDQEMQHDEEFESMDDRHLNQIFTGQTQIFDAINSLNRKLDEILGKEERVLGMIGNIQVGKSQGGGGGSYGVGTGPPMPIQRHEVEALLSGQRDTIQLSRDTHSIMQNIQHRVNNNNNNNQQAGVAQQGHQENQRLLNEVRDGVNVLRRELGLIDVKIKSTPQCPPHPSCITFTHFILGLFVHLVVLIAYNVYKSVQENKVKKFY